MRTRRIVLAAAGVLVVGTALAAAPATGRSTSSEWTALIGAVAHNPGAGGTLWRTDVRAVNPAPEPVSATVTLKRSGGGSDAALEVTIPAGAALRWPNIVETLFGVEASASVSGSLLVEASAPLLLSSRTYNQTDAGTYGQYVPATVADGVLGAGDLGALPQLRRTASFRTNIGVVNLAAQSGQATVRLFSADGTALGSFDVGVPAFGWAQANDPFAGTGEHEVAYATVEVGSGQLWAYASVVDADTGDPTTVPVHAIGSSTPAASAGVPRSLARTTAAATALYVDDDNTTGVEDGTVTHPYTTVGSALDAAPDGASILVAAGTYAGDLLIEERTLSLRGGFAGGSEGDYASGAGGDFTSRPGGSTLVGSGDDAVVTLFDAGQSVVDGFTITGGGGSGVDLPWTRSGGGVYAWRGAPTISGNVIEGNSPDHPDTPDADTRGGGIATEEADALIVDNIVRDNQAQLGGGISALRGSFVIDGNRIENNVGTSDHGGGLYAAGDEITISDNVFVGNEIGRELGYGWGGGMIVFETSVPARIERCIVADNYSPIYGSGIFIDEGARAVIENVLVYGNQVDPGCAGGGAVAVDGGDGVGSEAELRFVTIADNPCDSYDGGNAVLVEGLSSATVSSSILWGNNGDDVLADASSSVTVEHSTTEQAVAGAGNIHTDPLFADAAEHDYHLLSSAGRWSESAQGWVTDGADSPAIDAGDPALDCSAEPAPNGGRCNQGAFAGTAYASKSGDGSPGYEYEIAAIAHNPGAAGTVWRSDVGALNLGTATAVVVLTLHTSGGGEMTASASVLPGEQAEWPNIAESAFAVDEDATTSGALQISASAPLVVSARTFNQTDDGTYGQYLPAAADADAVVAGTTGWLPQLETRAGFRTNVGVLNTGASTSACTVVVFDADGNALGSPVLISVPAGRWKQVNDVADAAGVPGADLAYATVDVSDGSAWAYASVVDGETGDPTTIPVQNIAAR